MPQAVPKPRQSIALVDFCAANNAKIPILKHTGKITVPTPAAYILLDIFRDTIVLLPAMLCHSRTWDWDTGTRGAVSNRQGTPGIVFRRKTVLQIPQRPQGILAYPLTVYPARTLLKRIAGFLENSKSFGTPA
jgi:hypothetical protein